MRIERGSASFRETSGRSAQGSGRPRIGVRRSNRWSVARKTCAIGGVDQDAEPFRSGGVDRPGRPDVTETERFGQREEESEHQQAADGCAGPARGQGPGVRGQERPGKAMPFNAFFCPLIPDPDPDLAPRSLPKPKRTTFWTMKKTFHNSTPGLFCAPQGPKAAKSSACMTRDATKAARRERLQHRPIATSSSPTAKVPAKTRCENSLRWSPACKHVSKPATICPPADSKNVRRTWRGPSTNRLSPSGAVPRQPFAGGKHGQDQSQQ